MAIRARRVHKPGVPARVEQPPSVPAKEIFLRKFEQTLDERQARQVSGITAKELAAIRLEDQAFDERCSELEQQFIDKIEDFGFVLARSDAGMVRFFLERLRPEKYGNKSRIDINVRDVTKLSDEELEAYIAQCSGKKNS